MEQRYMEMEDLLLGKFKDKPAEQHLLMLYFEHMRYFHNQYTKMYDKLIDFVKKLEGMSDYNETTN